MSMSTMVIVGVVVIFAALLGLWASRRSIQRAGATQDPTPVQPEQWGVRVSAPAGRQACRQVLALDGKEFPLLDKPKLPLPDCPFPQQCQCTYLKLFDRRNGDRRSPHDRREKGQRYEPEKEPRRSGRDRRKKSSNIDWV